MNKVILMGRLTRDPDIRYSPEGTAIARFPIAVDRRFKKEQEKDADFFNCTAFGKTAEFVEKHLAKGTKILLIGRIQNDNYKNRDGEKVYSVQVMVDELEFAESKAAAERSQADSQADQQRKPEPSQAGGGFMNIPENVDEEELPFI